MNAFAGIRPNFPRGTKTRPPSFFPWRLQCGLSVFQWGSNPPPIFTLVIDTQTPHDSIGRAYASHRAAKKTGGGAFQDSEYTSSIC